MCQNLSKINLFINKSNCAFNTYHINLNTKLRNRIYIFVINFNLIFLLLSEHFGQNICLCIRNSILVVENRSIYVLKKKQLKTIFVGFP